MTDDPRIAALPDIHGHAKGEHKPFAEERPIPYTARMLFLWFFHACRRGSPRFVMVADHMNYLTFEDPAAVNLVRRALKLAQAGDLYGAAETAGVELGHAAAVCDGLRKGMRYSIGAEIDNDPRCRPDAQNIVDAMRPDGMIRSIHFLPITHPQHGENWMWAFDNPEFRDLYEVVGTERVWQIYMDTLIEAIDKLPGHIVGHFYVPAKFGHWPEDATLEAYEDRLLAACAERGLAVEINSRFFYKHYAGDDEQLARYRAAHLRLLRKAGEKGVMIAVGSDAHSPKDQGAGFDEVLALLDEANINEIAFPINGRLARVALRATEELRRQAAALAAAPAAPQTAPPEDDAGDESPLEAQAPTSEVAVASVRNGDGAPGADEPPQEQRKPAQRPARPRHKARPAARAATAEQLSEGTSQVPSDSTQPAASPPPAIKRPARKRPSRATARAAAERTVDGGLVASPDAPVVLPVVVPVPAVAPVLAPAKTREQAPRPAPVRPAKPATAAASALPAAPPEPAAATVAPAKKTRAAQPRSRPAAMAAPTKRAASAKKTASRSRTKAAAAKTSAKKIAPKRAGAKRAAPKKTAARKQAAAPAGRPVKKAAVRKTVKPTKRAAAKRAAGKPSAAKKPAAKRKVKPRR